MHLKHPIIENRPLKITKLKALILAGGQGTRLREETEFRPKPLVEIGGIPIIYHLMESLKPLDDFVVLTGHRHKSFLDYFANLHLQQDVLSFDFSKREYLNPSHIQVPTPSWLVTCLNTGEQTPTGGRIKRAEALVEGSDFFCTYGDAVSDLDINNLLEFHNSHNKIATMTIVHPSSRFGVVDLDKYGGVIGFREKPISDDWINAGYFVFRPGIFEFLGPDSVLEKEPLSELARSGELAAYQHDGFWQPMDTYREFLLLNEMWQKGDTPWIKSKI